MKEGNGEEEKEVVKRAVLGTACGCRPQDSNAEMGRTSLKEKNMAKTARGMEEKARCTKARGET